MIKFEWTTGNLKKLDTLWRVGRPAAEIAKVLGTSKNSVISKANKLHLPSRAATRELQNPHGIKLKKTSIELKITPSEWSHKAHNPKGLLELKSNECRWPIGEPGEEGFCFCGGLRLEGRPYCAEHLSIAYIKTVPKNERSNFR
jgi:GcrA cell cycle regulator